MLGNFRQEKGWVVWIEGWFGAFKFLMRFFFTLWFDLRRLWIGNYTTGLKLQIAYIFGALHF